MTNQPTAVTLLPCPMCRSEDIGHRSDGKTYLGMICGECGCHRDAIDGNPENEGTWTRAYADWNTRSPQPPSSDTRLREALEEIAEPIAAMQQQAKAEGMNLHGGYALQIASDPEYLKDIARKALSSLDGKGF